jgi:hypothetical protein
MERCQLDAEDLALRLQSSAASLGAAEHLLRRAQREAARLRASSAVSQVTVAGDGAVVVAPRPRQTSRSLVPYRLTSLARLSAEE